MLNKKFLFGAILSMAVLFTACSNGAPEISETMSETVTTSADVTEAAETMSAETTLAASEATVTTTAETEAIDISGVDYIKEALQAEWDKCAELDNRATAVNMYTADLNSDGINELFVNYTFGAGINGLVYVYDVSDGAKKLCEISARMWADSASVYSDEYSKTHVILYNAYADFGSGIEYAFFDIAYDEIKMPFFANDYQYHNDVGHVFEYEIYKNCEVVPIAYDKQKDFCSWRNFAPEKSEYVDRFTAEYVMDALKKGESNDISELVQKEVYEGLTYVSEIDMIYENSGYVENYRIVWDFEDFWQQAAPKLAEIYGN